MRVVDANRLNATPTSQILKDLDSSALGPVPLGTVLAAMGSRVHGVALILLALPDTLPLPLPSISTVLGIPLVIIAAHLVVYGEGSRLPERARRIKVSHRVIHAMAHYAAPVLRVLERLSRPRFPILLRSDRALGLICLYLSIMLLLPIPFLNAAPAVCLVAIAFGMIQRDGLIVAVGIAGTIAMTASLAFFADWVRTLFFRSGSKPPDPPPPALSKLFRP